MFTKQALKDSATSVSFARGLQYYKNKVVHDINVYRPRPYVYTIESVVDGSVPYNVYLQVDVKDNSVIDASCTCPYHYGGLCKHIIATGLAFIDYISEAYRIKAERSSDINVANLSKDFEQALEATALSDEDYMLRLRIIDGQKKHLLLYASDKLEDSDHSLLPWRWSTLLSYLHKAFRYSDGSFELSGALLDKVLDLISTFDKVFMYESGLPVEFSSEYFKPEIFVEQKDDASVTITARSSEPVFVGVKGAYAVRDNVIMRLWPTVPLSFYKALYKNANGMNIKASDIPEFIEDILPRLRQQLPLEAPSLPDVEMLNIQPEVHVYLRKGDTPSSIVLEAYLKYGEYISQNIFLSDDETASSKSYRVEDGNKVLIIPRQREMEDEANARLMHRFWYGFNPDHCRMEFYGQENIYRLIKDFDEAVVSNWKIHYEDGLRSLKLEKAKVDVDFDFSMENDYDLLEFDVDFYCKDIDITRQQLEQYIRENRRFIETNGKFVEITNRNELKELFDSLLNLPSENGRHYKSKLFNFPELDAIIAKNRRWIAKGNENFAQFKKEIKKGRLIKNEPIPQPFSTILRQYQKDGVNWMRFLKKYGFGGILADDMGLGKTLEALTLISLSDSDKPSLVICPKTLIYNWYSEVQKFTPQLKTVIIEGSALERSQLISEIERYDLVIASYPTVQKNIGLLAHKSFEYCILDEAQYIKNPKTKTAKSVKAIRSNYRLALTGTPIENNLMELWSIFDFLMPGFLGSEGEFKARYDNPIMRSGDTSAMGVLLARIRPFVLRRTKEEMLKELPPKIEQVSYAHLTPDQLALYATVLEQARSSVFEAVREKGFERSHIDILAALTRLRQICNHPALIASDMSSAKKLTSGKLEQFDELLDEAVEGGHKVLVFSQFVQMLRLLAAHLDKKSIPYCYLDGQTQDRQDVINRFNEDDNIKAFLISIKAGGFGLNLTSADTVIIFDPWWNPMVEMQATDRAYRIGQTRPVNVYRLITKGTIEEKILKLQEKKKTLFDNVINENNDIIKKLTWNDICEVFA